MSSVCRCSPKVRTCRISGSISVRAMRIPPLRRERLAQHLQVVEKLFHRAVGGQHLRQLVLPLRQRVGHHRHCGAGRARFFKRPLHPRLHADDEAPVILKLVLLAEDLRLGRVHLRHISLEPRRQRIAHRPLLRAGRQQVDDLVQLPLVVEQQMAARQSGSRRASPPASQKDCRRGRRRSMSRNASTCGSACASISSP